MTFKLSQRSLDRLEGVNEALVVVVKEAIKLSRIDFGVIEGLRTEETQRRYVDLGKSQTMTSKHLTGHAVDLMAYIDGQACWELNVYDDIADAMKAAAISNGVSIRWGAAWNIPDIREWSDRMADAMNHYIDSRRSENRRPFIDAPHFELS